MVYLTAGILPRKGDEHPAYIPQRGTAQFTLPYRSDRQKVRGGGGKSPTFIRHANIVAVSHRTDVDVYPAGRGWTGPWPCRWPDAGRRDTNDHHAPRPGHADDDDDDDDGNGGGRAGRMRLLLLLVAVRDRAASVPCLCR